MGTSWGMWGEPDEEMLTVRVHMNMLVEKADDAIPFIH